MAMDFQACLSSCRAVRGKFSSLFSAVPSSLRFSADGEHLLFLSAAGGAGTSLYRVSVGAEDHPWRKLYSAGIPQQMSRSEQLLRERMRATGSGVTWFEYRQEDDLIVAQDGPCCAVVRRKTEESVAMFPDFLGAVDYKLCPQCPTLSACVSDGDLWLLDAHSGKTHRLTHTATSREDTQLSAGSPSFIIQEEFDRYTGYWWQSTSSDGVYRILYEEVDESGVDVLHTFNPSTQVLEDYRYPRPGSNNADSALKLLELRFDDGAELQVEVKQLPLPLSECFGSEYLTRVGWMPQGDAIWFQVLDRCQKHLRLIVIPISAFTSGSHDQLQADRSHPLPYLLWEDKSECWINVTDVLEFLRPSETHPLRFLHTSEASGFQHLYLTEATPPPPLSGEWGALMPLPRGEWHSQALTAGSWVVFGAHVWADETEGVVYFEGNASSCLEKHLYAVRLGEELPCSNPVQLTPAGRCHAVTVAVHCNRFVSVFSSETQAPTAVVFAVSPSTLTAQPLCTIWEGPALPPGYTPPTPFSFLSDTGERLHGVVYPPSGLEQGKQYPTVLYVYGGPQIQLVRHEFGRYLPRLQCWVQHGFAVVLLDNRGSINRGLQFEAHIKGHMGRVEVEDQVAGLQHAATEVGYIDLARVAVVGWSYGGYLALMCLAQQTEVFKVAVAGAPVTDWMYYDTGYTERYLGVPPSSAASIPEYHRSSVLRFAAQLPTQPSRLLVVHGLNDENVLFTHTSLLADRMVALGRPYRLQLYTSERHGLRSPAAALHCDATTLDFLLRYLATNQPSHSSVA